MKKEELLDLSMFILRLVIGAIFVFHGAQKLFGMFNGVGLEGTAKMVEGMGFRYASTIALIWACIEFVGGIFLIWGIIARWAAVFIVFVVLVQLWKINIVYGFFTQTMEIEYALLIIASCVPIILLGGGSWSIWDG